MLTYTFPSPDVGLLASKAKCKDGDYTVASPAIDDDDEDEAGEDDEGGEAAGGEEEADDEEEEADEADGDAEDGDGDEEESGAEKKFPFELQLDFYDAAAVEQAMLFVHYVRTGQDKELNPKRPLFPTSFPTPDGNVNPVTVFTELINESNEDIYDLQLTILADSWCYFDADEDADDRIITAEVLEPVSKSLLFYVTSSQWASDRVQGDAHAFLKADSKLNEFLEGILEEKALCNAFTQFAKDLKLIQKKSSNAVIRDAEPLAKSVPAAQPASPAAEGGCCTIA